MSKVAEGRRKVVITGMGLVTPFGIGVEPYWQSVCEGKSGVSLLTHFNPEGLPCRFGGYLKDGDPVMDLPLPGECGQEPRFVRFALAATQMASNVSGWMGSVDPECAGVFMGTSGERPSLAHFAKIVYEARGENNEIDLHKFVRIWVARMGGGD